MFVGIFYKKELGDAQNGTLVIPIIFMFVQRILNTSQSWSLIEICNQLNIPLWEIINSVVRNNVLNTFYYALANILNILKYLSVFIIILKLLNEQIKAYFGYIIIGRQVIISIFFPKVNSPGILVFDMDFSNNCIISSSHSIIFCSVTILMDSQKECTV